MPYAVIPGVDARFRSLDAGRYERMDCNNIRLRYARFDAAHARARQMPTAVWDDGDWFELFDHTENRFSSNLVDCITGTCDVQHRPRFGPDCD